MNRRTFIQQSSWAGIGLSMPFFSGIGNRDSGQLQRLTILHTNDVHSHLEQFDSGKYAGMGGVARRAGLISDVRSQMDGNVLLLDSGDIFQGTPYFNFFKGEPELKTMSAMGYDASTFGNHDFDAGIDSLSTQLSKHASFPFVNCNYNFRDTPIHDKYKEFIIKEIGKVKIGITGLGIELDGLVPKAWYGNTQYLDPISNLKRVAKHLKIEEGCDYVICLSHLGYRYRGDKVSDLKLAKMSKHVDMILGGHTHTFLQQPDFIMNSCGQPVLVNQVGWGGIVLGRIDLLFSKGKAVGSVCDVMPVG